MLNFLHKHEQGISILEILLVLMVIAAGLTLGLNQYFQYKRTSDINQIQQSVDQLLQAGSAYYYATCSNVTTGTVSLQALQAMGLLPSLQLIYNPWGIQPFQVWIVGSSLGEENTPPYLIQVRADFSERDANEVGQIAILLGADKWTGGKALTWTRLPSQVLKHFPPNMRSPNGWMPTASGTYHSGQAMSSNLEVMNSDLAKFSHDEAANAQGFTCPD